MNAILLTIAATGLVAATAACVDNRRHTMNMSQQSSLERQHWDAARAHTVFFAHQSVGENILDGLRQIAAAERWPAIEVVDTTAGRAGGPAVLHAKVGQNGDPLSKLAGFREALDAGAGAKADVALVKFCFWDIRADTNVEQVFTAYKDTMTGVAKAYPHLMLVHTTVPLVVEDTDWKAKVRRLLGMTVPTDRDNAVREALNQKIRQEYASRAPMFDVAALEQPAGTTGGTPHLAAELSSDGAHLNDAGRKAVAAGFIRTLSTVQAGTAAEMGAR